MMDLDDKPPLGGGALSALDRAKLLSQALADAARRRRVSSRSRRAYAAGGFRARRGAKVARFAVIGSFIALVAVPSLGSAIYYAFVASDQYVAEARFTVSGGLPPLVDNITSLTGIPALAIIQDTQIVTNYIGSRAALEALENKIDLRSLYSRSDVDYASRFKPDRPIEKFVKYWNKMCEATIQMPAGIINLKVRAFSPEDANRIANAVIEISESLINDLNARMNRDTVSNAKDELDRTSQRLSAAQLALEKARNDEGLLDAEKTGDALNLLINDTRADLLKLQGQYTSQAKFVSLSAPQMADLKSRIDATAAQIKELESRLTNTIENPTGQAPLSASMTKFAELDLERQTAERLYAGSVAALELATISAERRMMYLNTFVRPVVPEEAQYPKRFLYPAIITLGALAIWGALIGLGALVRNNMA
jgi:capsular polysaccharide transport system permease protein